MTNNIPIILWDELVIGVLDILLREVQLFDLSWAFISFSFL